MKRRRSKIVIALLSAAVFSLLTTSLWGWHESWHALPHASLTIDGVADHQAKVYLSRDKQEIFVDPDDATEPFLYIVSLRQKRVGITSDDDFNIRTKWFALPSERRPLRDWVPNEFT